MSSDEATPIVAPRPGSDSLEDRGHAVEVDWAPRASDDLGATDVSAGPARTPATGAVGSGPLVRLAASLFREPVPVPARSADRRRRVRHTVTSALIALAVTLAAAAGFALRLPVPRWDTLWAEDAEPFLQDALDRSVWDTLLQPYAGYLHVFPRLCGEVAAALPLAWAPYVFITFAALLVGVVCWATWRLSEAHLPSPAVRLLLVAAVVLVPGGGLEAVGNVANSHSFLLIGALWALLGRPRSHWLQVAAHLLVVLAALSDPTALVLAPLALGRLIALRSPRERSVVISYVVALAVQLTAVLSTDRPPGQPTDLATAVFGYGYRVVSTTFLGLDRSQELAEGARNAITAVGVSALVLFALALAVARHRRLLVMAMVLASVAYYAIPCMFPLAGASYPPSGAAEFDMSQGARYTIVPSVLLITGLLLAAQALAERIPGPAAALVVLVAAVPLVTWAVGDYRPAAELRTTVTLWTTSLREFEADCRADPATPATTLPAEPGGGWGVELTCAHAGS